MAQRLARGAHNSEVTGSKPVAGTSHYRVHRSVRTTPRQINRLSSSEERTAHNREVTGSTPVGGISSYRVHRSVLTIYSIPRSAAEARRKTSSTIV
jgi:hypothetical protein